ncbi:MAG: NAD(P)-dependent oxidoreductase [Sedimentisphaerales bacterium]|nr:NAD(P)-dependent oxidoreductase [Sedimentisphaerales bacterium]
MDVFFYEAFEEEEKAIKRYLPADIQAGFSVKTIQECDHAMPMAPIISVRTQSLIPTAWAHKLSGILTRSTGYDHLVVYLKECGHAVPCGYLPLYCNRAVAEQAMLLWMALLRKLRQQVQNFSTFYRDAITGRECQGTTLLVVGVGNIGSEVVKIGQGLGMNVLGVDIVRKHPFVTYVSLNEGLAKADVIVCAMNLTQENIGYFRYDRLRQAKRGALYINIARGEFSPSQDLVRLLDEGHLGGVGLDVYNQESRLAVTLRAGKSVNDEEVNATLSLLKRFNAILTPHNAFNTIESVDRKSAHSVQQVQHFLKNGSFLWPLPVFLLRS